MGVRSSQFSEAAEVITARQERSRLLHEQRERRRRVYSSMINRVLHDEEKLNSSLSSEVLPTDTKLYFPMLPDSAILIIMKFCADDIKNLLAVSPFWHFKILEALDNAFSSLESAFALVHSHLLAFKKSFISTGTISLSNKIGTRIDRVLIAEPLPILAGHTIKLRYTYKLMNNPNSYKAEYKFDCAPKGKRTVWAHKDECRFHGDESKQAYTQQVPEVCTTDNIEIAFNWFNLQGLVDLDTIDWQPPLIQDTKAVLKSLQLASLQTPKNSLASSEDIEILKKKLYIYTISRSCEVEINQSEWYDHQYYIKPKEVYKYDHFSPFLQLIRTEFAGVDVTISRSTFKAIQPGIVPDSLSRIGIMIEVKPQNSEIIQEVKRMGLLYDRHRPIQLREGDTFVLYISRGG